VTGQLLHRCSISVPLLSYREQNERSTAAVLADRVAAGNAVAITCDAGTPTISDPGFRAVRECRRRKLPVYPIPGPTAAIAALCASGLPSDTFLFLGFPPPREVGRRKLLRAYADFSGTLICYESCHRIQPFAAAALEELGGDRTVSVVRELTKLHETWYVGRLDEVFPSIKLEKPRGEYVFLVAAKSFVL
jgi:16S rRNA (cytidine1402-2'-O)-methyltransferase